MNSNLIAIECEPVGDNVLMILESMLEEARAGELSAVAIATVCRDGSTGSAWSFLHNNATMLGSINRLAHEINKKMDGD
jgi:hypothetical protein